jgi:hypothetical protein
MSQVYFVYSYNKTTRAEGVHRTFRLTCEGELARILREDFSRIRDKRLSQVEAFVSLLLFISIYYDI